MESGFNVFGYYKNWQIDLKVKMSKKDKKCQIYLAGPFFNEDQIKRI